MLIILFVVGCNEIPIAKFALDFVKILLVIASYILIYFTSQFQPKKRYFAILSVICFFAYLVFSYYLQPFKESEYGIQIIFPILILLFALLFSFIIKSNQVNVNEHIQQITREANSIQMDMKLARSIQESLFPKEMEFSGLKYITFRRAHNQIGGDFFDFVKLREGNVGIFLTDVAGHGISSAMVASMIKVMVATIPYTNKQNPSALLDYLDKKMTYDFQSQHATAIYLFVNFITKQINFANAGHPYLIYQKKDEEFKEIETKGSLLGFNIRTPVADSLCLDYSSGDRFFIYTDGLIETTNPEGQLLETEGLLDILNKHKSVRSLDELKEKIINGFADFFKKSEFTDDAMFLIFELI